MNSQTTSQVLPQELPPPMSSEVISQMLAQELPPPMNSEVISQMLARELPPPMNSEVELRQKLPSDRTFEQLFHHFSVERELALKLMRASREERKLIYLTMYDTLFAKVPDHPRLTRRSDRERTDFANDSKLSFLSRHLTSRQTVLEFAPGDCKFAVELSRHVRFVYAVDISDQREEGERLPDNLKLIVYDGYSLDLADSSIDIVFSDHLVEHFHPEDTQHHFELVRRVLVPGGKYLFRTPHAFSGPHDISKFFSERPEGFHLKEWTYSELAELLRGLGFSQVFGYWSVRNFRLRMPMSYFRMAEAMLCRLPAKAKTWFSYWFLRTINVAAIK